MKTKHNISIIRPELHIENVKLRRNSDSRRKSKTFKKALQTFHTLETMAVNIYKFQITKAPTELNRQLIAALCNEMTHLQDFQVKLYEYGFKPKKLRWIYWIVGFALGFVSRLKGTKAILKTGIWVNHPMYCLLYLAISQSQSRPVRTTPPLSAVLQKGEPMKSFCAMSS